MAKQTMFRQGDVLLLKIDSLPKNLKKAENRIIAFGESSNHCHAVTDDVEVLENESGKFLQVNASGKLEHVLVSNPTEWTKEHNPIDLPAGTYQVIQQREYNPYERAIQNVRD